MSNPILRLYDGYSHTSPKLKPDVMRLQNLLIQNGFSLEPDGLFGLATENAVREYQRNHGLYDDGIVGPYTWSSLLEIALDIPKFVFSTTYQKNNKSLLEQMAEASKYNAFIEEASETYDIQPSVIGGVGSRESHWGLILKPKPGPDGTGDFTKRNGKLPPDGLGYGRGLMQIDYNAHSFARTGNWKDPRENILYGCKVLADNIELIKRKTNQEGIKLLQSAIAGYNCGPNNVLKTIQDGRDVDFYTAGRDYSKDVLSRAGFFQLNGWQ